MDITSVDTVARGGARVPRIRPLDVRPSVADAVGSCSAVAER